MSCFTYGMSYNTHYPPPLFQPLTHFTLQYQFSILLYLELTNMIHFCLLYPGIFFMLFECTKRTTTFYWVLLFFHKNDESEWRMLKPPLLIPLDYTFSVL